MDDRRFDALAKRLGTSRRSLLTKMLGLGGVAAVARLGVNDTEAARRGQTGPENSNALNALKGCWPNTQQQLPCCVQCSLSEDRALDFQLAWVKTWPLSIEGEWTCEQTVAYFTTLLPDDTPSGVANCSMVRPRG